MNETGIELEETALRQRFAALRAADGIVAPTFDGLLNRSRSSSGGLAWSALAMAGVVACFVAVLAWMGRAPAPGGAEHVADAAISEVMLSVAAEMPSDFLLAPTSDDVRRDIPRLTRADNEEVPFL